MKKTILLLIVSIMLCLSLAGCSASLGRFSMPEVDVCTYNNADFNEYISKEKVTIPGQEPGYGIGDPYILRHNGTYYLYVSGKDGEVGVKAWKSTNLVDWAQCTGEGLAFGYVSQDTQITGAYAPEVYYYDGTFYMYTSPEGKGHYILTATHPEGPFTVVTDNLGFSIDGSVFLDDDEELYFLNASEGGIRMRKMEDMTSISSSSILLDNTAIGAWTEGPFLIKANGGYYLTYTGTRVTSDGYRIGYSYSNASKLYTRGSFTFGGDNPILLNTEGAQRGLGHSSTVLGPDMDSYYIAYHSLNNAGGPNRSLNIDRLYIDGSALSTSAHLTGSVCAALPTFATHGEGLTEGLSAASTADTFTAEFNFSGKQSVQTVVGYTDASHYTAIQLDFATGKLQLVSVSGTSQKVVAQTTLNKHYNADALHTLRIAYREGVADVYFDNMCKLAGVSTHIKAGKIGYLTTGLTTYYTAFSNVARGLSDQLEVKQADTRIMASKYIPNGAFAGLTGHKLSTGLGYISTEGSRYLGAPTLTLGKKGDFARYLVQVAEDGFYAVEMLLSKGSMGQTIGIQIDGGEVYHVAIPAFDTEEGYIRTVLTELSITKGVHTIAFANVKDDVTYASFSLVRTATTSPTYTHTLAEYVERGVDYQTIWKLQGNGHLANAGTRQLVYFGDGSITDFTLDVDMQFVGDTSTNTAGIVFHADNYSASASDDYQSIQGYYVALNNDVAALERLNYSASERLKVDGTDIASGTDFHLKVVSRSNHIQVYIDGELRLDYFDALPFAVGRIGLYTNGAQAIYKNLSIQP